MHFKAQTANTQSMMKVIALPGFSDIGLHTNYEQKLPQKGVCKSPLQQGSQGPSDYRVVP